MGIWAAMCADSLLRNRLFHAGRCCFVEESTGWAEYTSHRLARQDDATFPEEVDALCRFTGFVRPHTPWWCGRASTNSVSHTIAHSTNGRVPGRRRSERDGYRHSRSLHSIRCQRRRILPFYPKAEHEQARYSRHHASSSQESPQTQPFTVPSIPCPRTFIGLFLIVCSRNQGFPVPHITLDSLFEERRPHPPFDQSTRCFPHLPQGIGHR